MRSAPSLDALVRARLQQWPQRPPGLPQSKTGRDAWLRGRPCGVLEGYYPFLKMPGSNRLRTLPDGLWLNFGGTVVEPFVDIFAVEACGSVANLYDKRARFAPSTQSVLAVCPLRWLLGRVCADDPTPRWRATGVVRDEPTDALVAPVRDMRVLYALKTRHYQGFTASQVPHPHEYFLPMDVLTQADAHCNPAVQALVARASVHANFLAMP